jgi:hypothetical protein
MFELTEPSSDLLHSLRHYHMPLSMSGEFRWGERVNVGPLPWPPRSQDLTLLDFNLWGLVKEVDTFLR